MLILQGECRAKRTGPKALLRRETRTRALPDTIDQISDDLPVAAVTAPPGLEMDIMLHPGTPRCYI